MGKRAYEKAKNEELDYEEEREERVGEAKEPETNKSLSDQMYNDSLRDYYEMKSRRMTPKAEDEESGITSDHVMAKLSGKPPNMDEINFRDVTETLFKGVFIKKKITPIIDNEGNQLENFDGTKMFFEGEVFDENFRVVLDSLRRGTQSKLATSRALGSDREAILLEQQSFRKTIERKKSEQNSKMFGMG